MFRANLLFQPKMFRFSGILSLKIPQEIEIGLQRGKHASLVLIKVCRTLIKQTRKVEESCFHLFR